MIYIVGLGNPGEEYEETRHNVGRIMVESFRKREKLPEVVVNKKLRALVSEGKVNGEKVTLILPETFMNKSGESMKLIITSKKKAEDLIVVNDDLDIPLGKFKITFNRGSGGHKGVESVIRAVKTEAFTRIKVGVSPSTASGKLKRPDSKVIMDFIVGKMRKPELEKLKKVSKDVSEALEMIITDGREAAMGEFNSR